MKESRYNYIVNNYRERIILYNSLNNTLFSTSIDEYNSLFKDLLENPNIRGVSYPSVIKRLHKLGFIVDDEFNELDYIKNKHKKTIFFNEEYHITINPTLKCNFNCWYCGVKEAGVTPEKRISYMQDDIIKRIVKHYTKIINDGKFKQIKIDWFGGEPLLHFNDVIRPISEAILSLLDSKEIGFSQFITTNGFLINDKMISSFNKYNINGFQITLDGNEKRHNSIRNANGIPSYKTITKNITNIINNCPNASVILRINYDKKTLLNLNEIIDDFKSLANNKRLLIDFQRVWQVKLENKENEMLKNKILEFQTYGFNIRTPKYRPQRFYSCYADKKHYAVLNFDGNLYKCSARDYSENMQIGKLLKSGEFRFNKLYSTYLEKSTFDYSACRNCKLLPLCFGPCTQKNHEYRTGKTKDFNKICLKSNTEINIRTFIIEQYKKQIK